MRAVDGTDAQAVAQEIASCDIMATAVGVNVLPFIAPNIAKGIETRGDRPLNIIICENLMDSADVLRGLIGEHISDAALLDNVGLIEASIGRMFPSMTPEMQQGDILLQWTEPYCELPLDEKGFIGPIPALKYICLLYTSKFPVKKDNDQQDNGRKKDRTNYRCGKVLV